MIRTVTQPYRTDRMSEYYTDKAEAVKILGETQIKMESTDGNMWDAKPWDLAVFAEIIEP